MRYNILQFIATGFILLMFSGCEDEEFLTKVDKMSSTESTYFTTEEEYENILFGAYSILQANNYQHIMMVSEAVSDNCYCGQGTDGDDEWEEFDDRGNENMFDKMWKKYNWGIHRCNFLEEKLPGPLSKESAIQIEAEMKFLRAYFRFNFVKVFGHVPLKTTSQPANPEQADPKDIYKSIAEDLVFAANNLPESYAPEWYGRVTKWAAKSLLARVYLHYTGYYNQSDLAGVIDVATVRTHLDSVITESGHGLVSDFRSLWPYSQLPYYTGEAESIFAGEDNKEIIFSVKYTEKGSSESYLDGAFDNFGMANPATGNSWIIYLGPRETSSNAYFDCFKAGWGFIPVTRKLYNTYEDNDKRKEGSIADLSQYGPATSQKDYTGYWQKKYQPLVDENGDPIAGNSGSAWQYGQGQDYYVIRFADVLLMGAELFLDVDNNKAQNYFDRVRKRAFDDADYSQVTVSKEVIFNERQLELAFEGQRYFDLLRFDGQDNLDYAKTNIDASSDKVITGGKEVQYDISFRKETKGLLQIPYSQIKLSASKLKQNAGWEM